MVLSLGELGTAWTSRGCFRTGWSHTPACLPPCASIIFCVAACMSDFCKVSSVLLATTVATVLHMYAEEPQGWIEFGFPLEADKNTGEELSVST